MKKYSWVWLYQVKEETVYLKNGILTLNIQTYPNAPIHTMVESSCLEPLQIIMVEKISPFHVKEVRTGIIFPIINVKDKYSQGIPNEHKITYPFGKVHTFVISRNNKLIERPVRTEREKDIYKHNHPFYEQYKEELQQIMSIGKNNIINNNKTKKLIRKQNTKKRR